ncbi:uncharacterized protein PHALS_08787 [Plasmopara halstedii]|uniref:Uncharacterized protein n=1 Tax=Plasmopara halstedii TaxID=4781 RepID=A0A0P1AEB0_PLAHL|nr:uncharacterized protein PHALS_08787 [Plasmopara halstedii]CEG38730.1 hypothetical protein PHALS_08787 [Plasmopara halstedii]|eukprot:XP_024575099.1 hypothetical protein PHALS_08787 [Plasmopara halstedii]
MEIERVQTRVNVDGKMLIEQPQQTPLIVPSFDDEDDSSCSDDEPAMTSSNMLNKQRFIDRCNKNNTEYGYEAQASFRDKCNQDEIQQSLSSDVRWDQVREAEEVTNTNGTSCSEIRDLRQQVKALQIQLEAQAPVPGLDIEAFHEILLDKEELDHDIRDVKIVHQAKSLRTLKRLLQREKQRTADSVKQCIALETTSKHHEQEIDTLKLKLQRLHARAAGNKTNSLSSVTSSETPTVSTNDTCINDENLKKNCEALKLKNTALQQELKTTQRALIREVGDDVPLEDIICNTDSTTSRSARRGRAQHIIILKSKVKRLQTQLANLKQGSIVSDAQSSENSATVLDVDKRAQQDLSDQQLHRQKVIDQLSSQRDELQDRLHRLTRKYDAIKARVQILDRERQEMRDKFQVLIEKSKTDDALIDALQRQLETWKSKLHQARRARTADGVKNTNQVEQAELERLRQLVGEHKGQSGERSASCSLSSDRTMPRPSEIAQYRAIAVEKERLTELVCSLKSQVENKDKQLQSLRERRGNFGAASETLTRITPPPSMPVPGDGSVSRIPRLRGSKTPPEGRPFGASMSSLPASLTVKMEQQQQQLKQEMETLRKTFRESMREKDDRIAELEQQHKLLDQSGTAKMYTADGMSQKFQELEEENAFLRQEYNRLKSRYEALAKENERFNSENQQ